MIPELSNADVFVFSELQHKMTTQAEGRKTIVNEYDNRPPSRVVLTEADLHPVFIVVQVLEKGQYFVRLSNTMQY